MTLPFTVPWWVEVPSVMGFYGLFYALFDRRLWRITLLHRIGLVQLPDLNGTWEGFVKSSFDEYATQHYARVKISQRWTQISIRLDTDGSKSHSLSAALLTTNPNEIMLSYEYLNEPKASNSAATMHTHRGTARLTIDSVNAPGTLEGEYYTGRDRRMYGGVHLERSFKS